MPSKKNLIGKIYGDLVVLWEHPVRKNKRIYWMCLCKCGYAKIISGGDLRSGKQKSCGCRKTKAVIKRNKERSGENSDCWKGGEIEQNGYIVVYSPYHPFSNAQGSGYVKRSRLVMEKYLGRFLYNDEIVHHINGKKNDDRIENLELMTNSGHLSLHHKGKKQPRNSLGQFKKGE